MYSKTSRAMNHALGVDAPKPTGGYIGSVVHPDLCVIKDIERMTAVECRAELGRLGFEITRGLSEREAVTKSGASQKTLREMSQRIGILESRKSQVRKREKDLNRNSRDERFAVAVKEICTPEMAARIFTYANGNSDTV